MKFQTVLIVAIAAALVFLTATNAVLAEQSDASTALTAANGQIQNCFNAAKTAEAAGADISQLTTSLNRAGFFLSQAQLAYNNNDFENVKNFATQSQNELSNFISDANVLKDAAAQATNVNFLLNVVGSIGGTIAVLVGSIAVWILLRKKYDSTGVQKSESATV